MGLKHPRDASSGCLLRASSSAVLRSNQRPPTRITARSTWTERHRSTHLGRSEGVAVDPSPSIRTMRARLAAHESWARTSDRSARTAPAREAAWNRFEREVDPEGKLDPQERARRAEHARKAYFLRLAMKSAQARRRRAGTDSNPDDAEARDDRETSPES